MPILKPRSRSISIRLSEDEFVTLKHLCSVTGARSVSDLTRNAMRVVLNGVNSDHRAGLHSDEFHPLLKDLERKIDQLEARIMSVEARTR
jgi:hypothetical protein